MKKTKSVFAVLLTLCMLTGCLTLSGCGGKKTITLEEMEKNSQTAEILKNHTSFQCTMTYAEDGTVIKEYVDHDMIYVMYPGQDENDLYIDGELKYISNGGVLAGALFVISEPVTFKAKDNMIFTTSDTETIKSCEEKDGKLYVSSEVTAAGTKDIVTAEGYTYNDGEHLTIDYILDVKTSVILSDKAYLVSSDGTKRDYVTFTVEYDLARPETAQTMLDHATATENTRKLTIITDPDTENEKSFSVSVPKGDAVQPYPAEGYTTMFTDRACTEPVTVMDRNADATVYMANGK